MPDKSMIDAMNDAGTMLWEAGYRGPLSATMNRITMRKLNHELDGIPFTAMTEAEDGGMTPRLVQGDHLRLETGLYTLVLNHEWPDDLITVEAMSDGN